MLLLASIVDGFVNLRSSGERYGSKMAAVEGDVIE